jgi:hypothetical protein
MKNVSGEALGVDPNQRRLGYDVPKHQDDGSFRPPGLRIPLRTFETRDAEVAKFCGEVSFSTLCGG